MTLLYLSDGNIPSKKAHTFQIMKMSEAFASLISDFTLITGTGRIDEFCARHDLWEWYNIRQQFHLERLVCYDKVPLEGVIDYSIINRQYIPAAIKYIFQQHPQLVYTRSMPGALCLLDAGIDCIWELHSSPDYVAVDELLTRVSRDNFIGLVTETFILKEKYVERGIPENKILVLGPAVDQLEIGVPLQRSSLNLPENKSIVVYAGSFMPNQGEDLIVECAIRLPEVYFIVLGGFDWQWQQYRYYCSDIKNIDFRGFVPKNEMASYLQLADICLMPYRKGNDENDFGIPLKMMDYIASRKPIIATQTPALERFMCDGENCLLVSDNSRSFANAIVKLVDNPGFATKLAENCWRDHGSFTWTKRAQSIIDHFHIM